ncbi:MAG: MBL fold metallo-hydrolase [Actinomycetota bacterium]
MRRTHHLLIAILAVVVLAVSCGDDDGDDNADPAAATVDTAATVVETSTRTNGSETITWNVDGLIVHTYTNTEANFANSTAVIETEDSLVLIDAHFAETQAQDFRDFADSLDKPIDRIFITHAHSDHIGGLANAFADIDSYSTAGVIAAAAEEGITITDEVEPSTIEIGGVTFRIDRYLDAEAEEQIVISIPAVGVMAIGDLIYSDTHAVMAQTFDSWLAILDELEAIEGTTLVIPGHGTVGGPDVLFADMNGYLETARELWEDNDDADAFSDAMVDAFPDRPGEGLLRFGAPRLYPKEG